MLRIKKLFKWGSTDPSEKYCTQRSLLLTAYIGMLENVLFWKNMLISLSFTLLVNIIFFVCAYRQISLLGFILSLFTTMMIIDSFEAWLKYKHRTSFLKKLASCNENKLNATTVKINYIIQRKWKEFTYLREINHTKAFILVNIIFGILFFLGKYINGYLFAYILSMFLCFSYKIVPPLLRFYRKIQQDIESDSELEGLIPDASETNIKLLSIEAEPSKIIDERQSLEYWKPVDVPLEEGSDSSDNSSSLVSNISMEKIHTLDKDVETSDSSEDEYIPLVQQKDQLQSTFEVQEPASTWSSSAYNAFRNITGAMANMMSLDTKKQHISSADSSDGFEMVDKNDLN